VHLQLQHAKIELVQGDVTCQAVDAIVNAANSRLAGGGGVDGAIHRAAGPSVMQETASSYPDGCLTGQAVITGAGRLAAQYIIHAVGPVYSGGGGGEAAMLESAYRASLELAAKHDCQSIALPALSTGAYRYPFSEAAEIAIAAAVAHARQHPLPTRMRFVLFDGAALAAFEEALGAYAPASS
jgi:O-acetyl-ADP-ribose deacetylase (regulator of RNase III)